MDGLPPFRRGLIAAAWDSGQPILTVEGTAGWKSVLFFTRLHSLHGGYGGFAACFLRFGPLALSALCQI